MKKKEIRWLTKSDIIERMILIIRLLKLTELQCSYIENEIHNFDYSKPVNTALHKLNDIGIDLDKNLKKYCGKDFWHLLVGKHSVFKIKIERKNKCKKL